ncbi:acyl-CoA thioesterase [bacterium]|nr:acyl-CoA thioesterase [bacterium]
MENRFEQKVSYCDTDAYGVVWHGSYLRWLEIGRMYFCDDVGLDLVKCQENNLVLPLTGISVKYKSPAKLGDIMVIETKFVEYSKIKMTFNQRIYNKETGVTYIEAVVDVVPVSGDGKLYRKMPEILKSICEKYAEEKCV